MTAKTILALSWIFFMLSSSWVLLTGLTITSGLYQSRQVTISGHILSVDREHLTKNSSEKCLKNLSSIIFSCR